MIRVDFAGPYILHSQNVQRYLLFFFSRVAPRIHQLSRLWLFMRIIFCISYIRFVGFRLRPIIWFKFPNRRELCRFQYGRKTCANYQRKIFHLATRTRGALRASKQ